jgi:hypothetical protein
MIYYLQMISSGSLRRFSLRRPSASQRVSQSISVTLASALGAPTAALGDSNAAESSPATRMAYLVSGGPKI